MPSVPKLEEERMAFRDLLDGVKNFFGPNNTFFNGAREDRERDEDVGYYSQQNAQPMPAYQQGYQPPRTAYAPSEQPVSQGEYPQMQQGYQPQAAAYQQPYQPQAAAQQPIYQSQPLQQGYQPPQQGYAPQQMAGQGYSQPRNRRSAQHMQQQNAENVVPFPASAQQPAQQQPAAQSQTPAAAKQPAACVVNVRSIADCRSAIGILRTGDCVLSVMDNIADQAEVRRYVDTLNGACFSLGCTMTRLSARVGVYLLAPVGMQVYTDQATTQMNAQSRAPQRRSAQAQPSYRAPYQAPQAQAYAQPTQPYGAAGAYQTQGYSQPYAAPQQPVYQPAQPTFSAQSPAQGYTPDVETADFHTDAVM